MSWNPLPTDYTDATYSGLRKYQQIDNEDGSVSFDDVTEYQNESKSYFGALDANRITDAINTLMSKTIGLRPRLVIAAPTGAFVKVKQGGITFTKGNTGTQVVFDLDNYGEYQVWAERGSEISTSVYVNVDTVKIYNLSVNFFSATITVFFPDGSTVTCTNGSTVYTASTTTGTYQFTVGKTGTWRVKAVLGDEEAYEDVVITTNGQSESVTLDYKLWLYKDGDLCGRQWRAEAKPMSQNSGSAQPTIAYNADSVSVSINNTQSGTYKGGIFYLSDKVDLTEYSTLKMEYDKTGKTFYLQVWPSIGSYGTQNRDKYVQLSDGTNNTATIDVSSLSGEKFVGMCFESSGGTGTVTIKRLYLER